VVERLKKLHLTTVFSVQMICFTDYGSYLPHDIINHISRNAEILSAKRCWCARFAPGGELYKGVPVRPPVKIERCRRVLAATDASVTSTCCA